MAIRTLYAAPTGNVVPIATLAAHLRIDSRDEDAVLNDLLREAVAAVEDATRRRLLTQTWDESFDDFTDPLMLSEQPVSSITSVTYTDSNGDTQTLSTSIYELGKLNGWSVVRKKYDQNWPSTRAHEDVVTVRYVVGYGTAASVPDSLLKAVRVHAAWNHRHREGEPIPDGFYHLISPYRLRHV
ncbi:MAG: phage head-tail connector protein [Bacilli bacterium]|jgi:uncharacterized phiE125 gp8 family phage protein